MDESSKSDLKYVGGISLLIGALTATGIYFGSQSITPREPVIVELWHASKITGPWSHLADVTSSNITFTIPGKTNFTLAWEVNEPLYSPGLTNQFYQVTNQQGFFKIRNRGAFSGLHSAWNQ